MNDFRRLVNITSQFKISIILANYGEYSIGVVCILQHMYN